MGELAAEEVARCMDELGMLGSTVSSAVLERTLDDPAFEPVRTASVTVGLDRRERR